MLVPQSLRFFLAGPAAAFLCSSRSSSARLRSALSSTVSSLCSSATGGFAGSSSTACDEPLAARCRPMPPILPIFFGLVWLPAGEDEPLAAASAVAAPALLTPPSRPRRPFSLGAGDVCSGEGEREGRGEGEADGCGDGDGWGDGDGSGEGVDAPPLSAAFAGCDFLRGGDGAGDGEGEAAAPPSSRPLSPPAVLAGGGEGEGDAVASLSSTTAAFSAAALDFPFFPVGGGGGGEGDGEAVSSSRASLPRTGSFFSPSDEAVSDPSSSPARRRDEPAAAPLPAAARRRAGAPASLRPESVDSSSSSSRYAVARLPLRDGAILAGGGGGFA